METTLAGEQPVSDISPPPSPERPASPSPLARWTAFMVLFVAYLPMQIVFAIPAISLLITLEGPEVFADLDRLMSSQLFLWMTLLSAALAAVLTIMLAAAWPGLWRVLTAARHTAADWFAWRELERLPLWAVSLITLAMLLIAGLGISAIFGPSEIQIQMQLFSTPALQVASSIIVSTVVPLAEELLFRGALYNALLRPRRQGEGPWARHVTPFVLTTLAFAIVHLFAGFETAGAIIQILLLSAYLTALRTLTGSVKASALAHLLWNAAAALALIATSMFGL